MSKVLMMTQLGRMSENRGTRRRQGVSRVPFGSPRNLAPSSLTRSLLHSAVHSVAAGAPSGAEEKSTHAREREVEVGVGRT